MVDMTEHTMMFTLNGEILLDDSGSELAFKDFDTGDGKCRAQAGGPARLCWSVMHGGVAGGRVHATQLFPSHTLDILFVDAPSVSLSCFQ